MLLWNSFPIPGGIPFVSLYAHRHMAKELMSAKSIHSIVGIDLTSRTPETGWFRSLTINPKLCRQTYRELISLAC